MLARGQDSASPVCFDSYTHQSMTVTATGDVLDPAKPYASVVFMQTVRFNRSLLSSEKWLMTVT